MKQEFTKKDKVKLLVELTFDEYMPYQSGHPDEKQWIDDVIFKEDLNIHSNEIGDFIGTMRVLKIDPYSVHFPHEEE